MPKSSKRAASNKRLEALLRAQKMNELLKMGGIQSQALLDSAGESRPSDESHVVELLDSEKFTRSEMSGAAMHKGSAKKTKRAKVHKKSVAHGHKPAKKKRR